MKKLVIILIVIIIPIAFFLSGPKPKNPKYDIARIPSNLNITTAENYVLKEESSGLVRPDNQARIIWNNDSLKNKTEYCILYLHGFSACWYEGFPVNLNIAQQIGANAYFARLASHGVETPNPLIDMLPDSLYNSAQKALFIANALGRKVIVIGTSTGGTLALKLASDFPDLIHSLVLLSPNIAIKNPSAFVLTWPWGLQIARLNGKTGNYRVLAPGLPCEDKYWYQKYRWEGTVLLQKLVVTTMKKSVFQKVKQPVFLGYYYKDEEQQDNVVKVDAMLEMFDNLETPDSLKIKVAFPEAATHAIANGELSKSSHEVELAILQFVNGVGRKFVE